MAIQRADGGAGRAEGRTRLALLLLLALAAVLRSVAASNDLWVDELYSLQAATHLVHGPLDVLTAIHSDNNHYLNTLWLWACGAEAPVWMYRLPAIGCGVGAVAAAYWACAGRPNRVRLLFAAMIAFSFPLIVYSSEARGYSGAVCAAIVAFGAARRWERQPDARTGALFVAACVLGMLSHLTFLFVWAALAVWLLVGVGGMRGWKRSLMESAMLHALPGLCLLLLYVLDLRLLMPLGGPKLRVGLVVQQLAAWSFGWPGQVRWGGGVVGGVAVGFMICGWIGLWRRADRAWVFYAVLFGVPLVLLLVRPPTYLFPRYLLFLVPFAYLLIAETLTGMCEGMRGRVLAAIVGGLWLIGEAVLLANFFVVGRGNPSGAVKYMGWQSQGPGVTITSVDPSRAVTELEYFNRYLPAGEHFVFVEDYSHGVPEWLLVHGEAGVVPPTHQVLNGVTWTKAAWWDASPVSGQVWAVYQPAGGSGTRRGADAASNGADGAGK